MNWTNEARIEFELRVFKESYSRIEKCLDLVSQEQLWLAPNDNMVSIGCLVKHLIGNAMQWVYGGLLQKEFQRDRDFEFITEPRLSQKDLLQQMREVEVKIRTGLKEMIESDLSRNFVVQGFETTGFSALIHAIEHFSYHTGQISLLTKLFQNVDLGYYDNHDLDV